MGYSIGYPDVLDHKFGMELDFAYYTETKMFY